MVVAYFCPSGFFWVRLGVSQAMQLQPEDHLTAQVANSVRPGRGEVVWTSTQPVFVREKMVGEPKTRKDQSSVKHIMVPDVRDGSDCCPS